MQYIRGLKTLFARVTGSLAQPGASVEPIFASIARAAADLDRLFATTAPAEFTAPTRAMRGWLAYFARRERFDRLVEAIARARLAFEAAMTGLRRFRPPAIVEFALTRGIFSLRGQPAGTRVCLPAGMICFDDGLFARLAQMALRKARGARQAVLGAMAGESFQQIQAEIESLGGIVERPAGRARDLAAAFDRVNAEYFGARMPRPRLTWSRTLTRRKFGHYDHLRDTVMISATLDDAEVPEFVVDYVLYHELLHKQHGMVWSNGRARVHTPTFKQADRNFARYAEADEWLKKLARRGR
ncbi:MAG: hypothetical protein PHU85_17265 [Phycisphaerae bacterium]|nr:hypothetical protein [Phycisphaerae bacterium]